MKNLLLHTLFCLVVSGQNYLLAQDKINIKFGKIAAADFTLPDSAYLKDADAIYIADIGSTEFLGNKKGWFTMEYKRHVRMKIMNTNGFEAATFNLPLYYSASGDEEKVAQVKAITYNLENGVVIETPLKSDQIFTEKKDKRWKEVKFTLPGVKVGSIIDVQYTIDSDFFTNLQSWNFQGGYPRLWSEYEVRLPEFFTYVFLSQGYLPFHINKAGETFNSFSLTRSQFSGSTDFIRVDSRIFTHRWVQKDVPALKEEPYTSTLENHISKIEFQLQRIQFNGTDPGQNYMDSWPTVVEKLNADEQFGRYLYTANNWMDDEVKKIIGALTDPLEKAQKIYAYIQGNFTCTNNRGKYLSEGGLRNVFKTKKGDAADLNLMLITLLNHEKITSYPVLLSTKGHGFTNELYPLMDRFNLAIAYARIDTTDYFLDASDPLLGFGKLNSYCYNGHARVITGQGIPVYLEADNLKEKKVTTFFADVDEKTGKLVGQLTSTLGYYESLGLREAIKEKGKDEVIKSMQASMSEATIVEPEFEHLNSKDTVINVKYILNFKNDDEDIIYLEPMMGEGYKKNPFASAERLYPVEMPYCTEETYVATIEIPKGYVVDEIPKSARVNLNDDEGKFEYLIGVQDGKVMLRSKLVIGRANFAAEDYQTLRDFFGYVVKKHSEQIVFKKVTK